MVLSARRAENLVGRRVRPRWILGAPMALWLFAKRHRLSMLRACDYVASVTPFGLILVSLARPRERKISGWPSSRPWAAIFPGTHDGMPRHPAIAGLGRRPVHRGAGLSILTKRYPAPARPTSGTLPHDLWNGAVRAPMPAATRRRPGRPVARLHHEANAQPVDDADRRDPADPVGTWIRYFKPGCGNVVLPRPSGLATAHEP